MSTCNDHRGRDTEPTWKCGHCRTEELLDIVVNQKARIAELEAELEKIKREYSAARMGWEHDDAALRESEG